MKKSWDGLLARLEFQAHSTQMSPHGDAVVIGAAKGQVKFRRQVNNIRQQQSNAGGREISYCTFDKGILLEQDHACLGALAPRGQSPFDASIHRAVPQVYGAATICRLLSRATTRAPSMISTPCPSTGGLTVRITSASFSRMRTKGGADNASPRMELINSIGGHDGGLPILHSGTPSLEPLSAQKFDFSQNCLHVSSMRPAGTSTRTMPVGGKGRRALASSSASVSRAAGGCLSAAIARAPSANGSSCRRSWFFAP
jgi:hypothetical protein